MSDGTTKTKAYLSLHPADGLTINGQLHPLSVLMPGVMAFLPIFYTREDAEKYAQGGEIREVYVPDDGDGREGD